MNIASIVAWLSKRYPEQLVVTKQDYTELRQEVASYNVAIQELSKLNDRLTTLEVQVRKLNDANGFVSTAKGSFSLER